MLKLSCFALVVFFSACSSVSEGGTRDVSGEWTGTVTVNGKTDRAYLVLTQADATVTGQSCETKGSGCITLGPSSMEGSTLTVSYDFDDPAPQHVEGKLTLSRDEAGLSGTMTSTKCSGCVAQATFTRVR
jgi:hypothetical protein